MRYFDHNDSFKKRIAAFKKEVERLFYRNFGHITLEDLPYSFKADSSPIDIYATGNKLVVEVELPGVKQDGVAISVHENILAVKWKLEPRQVQTVNFFCMERRFGSFEKFILLPITPAKRGAEASLKNGVLSVSFDIGDIFVNSETIIPLG